MSSDGLGWKIFGGIVIVIVIFLVALGILYIYNFFKNKDKADFIHYNTYFCDKEANESLCKIPVKTSFPPLTLTSEYNRANASTFAEAIHSLNKSTGMTVPLGATNTWFKFNSDYNDIPYGVASVNEANIIIIFRGVLDDSEKEIRKDTEQIPFNNDSVHDEDQLMCHKGWLEEFNKFRDELTSIVSSEANKDLPVFITGYDMGASYATFTTKLVLEISSRDRQVTSYTFGAPRCVNKNFADSIETYPNLIANYRLVNISDENISYPGPVYSTGNKGSELYDYSYVGNQIIFDDNRESFTLNHSLESYYHNL